MVHKCLNTDKTMGACTACREGFVSNPSDLADAEGSSMHSHKCIFGLRRRRRGSRRPPLHGVEMKPHGKIGKVIHSRG